MKNKSNNIFLRIISRIKSFFAFPIFHLSFLIFCSLSFFFCWSLGLFYFCALAPSVPADCVKYAFLLFPLGFFCCLFGSISSSLFDFVVKSFRKSSAAADKNKNENKE